MNEQTEKLNPDLLAKVNAIQSHVNDAKTNLSATYDTSKAEIRSKVDAAKAKLNKQKARAEQAKDDFEARAGRKIDEIKARIGAKKEEHATEKAFTKAEDAEDYAAACLDMAIAAVAEADVACLLAVDARLDAEDRRSNT